MNKKSIVFLSTIFLLLAAVMFLVSEARANITIPGESNLTFDLDFNPVEGEPPSYEPSWELNLNESVTIDVYVSNIPMFGLRHMGFTLEYDRTQLNIVNNSAYIDNEWLYAGGPFIEINPAKGEIKMFGGAGTGIGGNHNRLGRFSLECIALGTSNLLLFDSDHGGKDYDKNFDDFILQQDTVLDDQIPEGGIFMGTITTGSNVPIPGSFLLLACGLFGLAVLKRERS